MPDRFCVHAGIWQWTAAEMQAAEVAVSIVDSATKAVEDQDHLTFSENMKRAATRLRLSLDLSPQDADHEMLAGKFTYPEWNRRTGDYMPGHTRVLEAPAKPRALPEIYQTLTMES